MDAQTIVNVLDNKLSRGDTVEGRVTWLGRRGKKFTALIDNDGDVLMVAYELRPGVYIERETKWSQPYDAPRNKAKNKKACIHKWFTLGGMIAKCEKCGEARHVYDIPRPT